MKKSKFFALVLLICALTLTVKAQIVDLQKQPIIEKPLIAASSLTANYSDFKLNSKLMNREMPYRVIFPANYDSAKDKKFAVIYLLHGLFGHFNNWAEKSEVTVFAQDYEYLIVMPEGNNGWYADSVSIPNDRYETYIAEELISEIDKKFRTIADKRHRAIAGLSMGGYGALKFGIKYPEKFILAGSFSGAVSIASFKNKEELPAGLLRNSVISTFGDAETETKKSNDIFKIADEISKEKISVLPFLYLDCGTEDELGLLSANRQFADILVKQKIPHEFRQLPGKHNWAFWNSQLAEFLRVTKRFIKADLVSAEKTGSNMPIPK